MHSPHQRPSEQDLREFGAGVETVGAEVGIDLVDGGEGCRGEGGAVEVGGHEDEAGIGRGLEVGEKGEGEEKLREVIYLEMRVEVIGCEVEFSYPFARVEDELDVLDSCGCPEARCISYCINLPLVFQLLCDLTRPF